MKRIIILCLTLVLVLGISATASAADMGDKDKNITLTVSYHDAGTAVSGATVKLYKIAAMDKNFNITADPTFAGFKDAIENKQTDWYILADSIQDFIKSEKISCDDQATINASGFALFPSAGNSALPPGVYLLHSERYVFNGKVYFISPVIISLPNYRSDGQLSNHVTANIKFYPMEDHPIDLKVEKKWDNKGYNNKQPEKITVELLRDNEVVPGKTIELSKNNNWTYTWKNLEPYKYTVREKAVSGYTASYSDSVDADYVRKITITNTYTTTSSSGSSSSGNKLPQTGQLTWPIPWMAASGMLLFALGWWLCFGQRKDSYED